MNFDKSIQALLVEYERQLPKEGEQEIYVALIPNKTNMPDMSIIRLTPLMYNHTLWQKWLNPETLYYTTNKYYYNNFKDAQQDLLSKLTTHTTYNYRSSEDKERLAQKLQEVFEPYVNLICKKWFLVFNAEFPRAVYLGIQVDVDAYKPSTHAQEDLYGF
jgi:hypothetical protein